MNELDLVDLGFSHCQDVDDYVYPLTDRVRLRCDIRRLRAHVWVERDADGTGDGVEMLVYMNSFGRLGLTELVTICNLIKNDL